MKITDAFNSLIKKKDDGKEYYFSLYVDVDAAAVAVWSMDQAKSPTIASFAHGVVTQDSWDARTKVIDRLLSAAEEKAGSAKTIVKTVFGLPGAYLTPEANIAEFVRPELKKIARVLELHAVGFVPLTQALAFSLTHEDGVPASIILIGCAKSRATVTQFRVGKQMSEDTVEFADDPASSLEAVLKKNQDGDVLPSRMLLYGGDMSNLEDIRSKLLKHPWPSRTNFLHFPKIEIVQLEPLLHAVSLVGAAELATDIGISEDSGEVSTAIAQPRPSVADHPVNEIDEVDQEVETIGEAIENDEQSVDEEISNVEMVTPESLGFKNEDVLEDVKPEKKFTLPFSMPTIPKDIFAPVGSLFSRFRRPKSSVFMMIAGLLGVVLLFGVLLYFLPRVTVTVLMSPQSVDESSVLTANPTATIVDPVNKMIPGHTQTKSISGEKTVAVTGKKSIGDPAKGSLILYNKVTAAKTFSKGTIVTTGSLSFTLDSDVSIASASESIGSITFGKATANVTAKEIGPNSNVSAGSEFTFAGMSSSQASARNDAAFSGGTSKQVTVVSRADQDGLVKALTDDLVGQAKSQLSASATGGERLIDQTIKTAVSDKSFDQEVDQQSNQLHGKITITVTGISISDEDIKGLLTSLVAEKIPSGYVLAQDQTAIEVSKVTVKKDGSISLTAKLSAIALPTIDTAGLKSQLAGKDVNAALSILKQTTGVTGAEYKFTLSPITSHLPMNKNNITITTMVQQ